MAKWKQRRTGRPAKKTRLISVAMIARNEAGSLLAAIESAKRFANEIIVVDTGSTDDTVAIAKAHGCHVHRFEWVHDFAKARNFAFSKCRCDYIFWQDPDETVPAEDAPKVVEMAEWGLLNSVDEFVYPTYLNGTYRPPERDLPGYGPGVVVMKPRMVRRGRLLWRWNIHEDLYFPFNEPLQRCVDENAVRVFNHGNAAEGTTEYYHALMVIGQRDHPTEPHYLLYLAEHLLIKDLDPHGALGLLDRVDVSKLAGGEQTERYWLFVGQAWKTLAVFAHDQGHTEQADDAANHAAAAYNNGQSMRGPCQAASMFLFLGRRATFDDIVTEILEKHPGELMAVYFKRLSDETPEDDENTLNARVGDFLGALRGGTSDMETAYTMALAGATTPDEVTAEPWSESTETRQIVVVVAYRVAERQPERRRNFEACMASLAAQDVPDDLWRTVVVEQDVEKTMWGVGGDAGPRTEYLFDRSYEPFNRGRAFNFGVSHAGVKDDDLVCLMDADMLVDPGWLRRCLTVMTDRAMLPYDRAIYMTERSTVAAIERGPDNADITGDQWHSQGGCIWMRADLYSAMNGHDERYVGWGSADRDFYHRLTKALGHPPQRMAQPLYHMWHPTPDESRKDANAALFRDTHGDVEKEVAKT